MVKKLINIILILCFPKLCIAQNTGVFNNGGSIIFNSNLVNSAYIIINGANGHFTNSNGGVVHILNTKGNIILQGNWYNTSNNSVFSGSGSTVTFDGGNQEIGPDISSGGNSTIFYNVNLRGTGIKTLNIQTTVGGISTTSGILDLGTRLLDLNRNKLIISNPLSIGISRSTGMIISETDSSINPSIIEWRIGTDVGPHIFPFGKWNGTYIPFTFDKSDPQYSIISVSTRSTLFRDNLPWSGISNVLPVTNMNCNGIDCSQSSIVDRWWDITSTVNPLTGGANLTFTYDGIENTLDAMYQTGSLSCQHWNGNSWDMKAGSGTGVITGTGTVTAMGLKNFSPYVIVADFQPLDIDILDFRATCDDGVVVISWQSVSPNNNPFILEKSYDGKKFEEISTIISHFGTNEIKDISSSLTTYYRLKQINNDNKSDYSSIISSSCKSEKLEIISTRQINDYLYFTYSNFTEDAVNFSIVNAVGQKILSGNQKSNAINEVSINTSNVSSGTYFLILRNDYTQVVKKIFIIK